MTTPAEHYGTALRLLDGIGEPVNGMPWPHGDWARANWHLRRAAALEGLDRATQPRRQGGRPIDKTGPTTGPASSLVTEPAIPQGYGPPSAQRSSQGLLPAAVGDVINADAKGISDNVVAFTDGAGYSWHRNDDPQFGSLTHAWYRRRLDTNGGWKVTHRDHTMNLIRYFGPLTVSEVRHGEPDEAVVGLADTSVPVDIDPVGDSATRHAAERMRAQLDQLRELADERTRANGSAAVGDIAPREILDILGEPSTPSASTIWHRRKEVANVPIAHHDEIDYLDLGDVNLGEADPGWYDLRDPGPKKMAIETTTESDEHDGPESSERAADDPAGQSD